MESLPATNGTGTPPRIGLRDELRLAYHLLLSGWEVQEVAAWLGLRPECVHHVNTS